MKPQHIAIGKYGEQLAVAHLEDIGYRVIARNWRCARGEIDIVAQAGDTIVFVEVKTRRRKKTAYGFEAITPAKREKLIQSVALYLSEHQLDAAVWRIDVIAVAIRSGQTPIIEQVEDALGW